MNKRRLFFALFLAVMAGVGTPFLIRDDWLSYAFGAGGLTLLIFGGLAASSADDEAPKSAVGLASWLVIGSSQPLAKVKDPQALVCFFLTLTYMAGLTIGAFAAV